MAANVREKLLAHFQPGTIFNYNVPRKCTGNLLGLIC